MSKFKRLMAAVLTAVMLLTFIPASSVLAGTWKKKNGEWYYYQNGKKLKKCWLYVGGKKYALDDKGRMITSKNHKKGVKIDGNVYFFTKKGAIKKKCWKKVKISGKTVWYYLSKSGPAYKGRKKIGKKYYYFDETDCFMYTKEITGYSYCPVKNQKYFYFLNKDGSLKTKKWTKITYKVDDTTSVTYNFYVGTYGTPVTGWKKIDGSWYYFDSQNYRARVEGVTKMIDGEYYTFDANGVCQNK